MIYGLYSSAAGMLTNEYRQNVIANNLANADTVGFKQDIAVFAERPPESLAGNYAGPSADNLDGLSGGVWLGRTQTDFSPGPLKQTDQPLDVALDGPGFLTVEVNGRPQYTRDGRLMKDATGQLRAVSDGAPVLGLGNLPIMLNPVGGRPSVDEDGRIYQNGAMVGRLALADFADYGALRPTGAGRFDAGDAQPGGSSARVFSGHLESSGVEPVRELVNMIETSRAYQINAQMIAVQDQSIGRLVSVLAR